MMPEAEEAMFIGHFGIGFGAKRYAPQVSLGVLFIAAQFLDLLWPLFLLFHVEHVAIAPGITKSAPLDFTDYPVSHSFLMAMVWGAVVGGFYWLARRNTRYAVIVALCVVSHWVLDLLVHIPDLPLYPGNSPKVGLGLWNHPVVETVLESIIFITGIGLYGSKTRARSAFGRYGLWILVALLVLTHVSNMISPPPTSVMAIAWLAQFQWVFVALAFLVDRYRTPTAVSSPG